MTPEDRTKLERAFSNCASGLTYRKALEQIAAERPDIRRIFEWGPGASTLLLLDLFPEAEIYGAEHDAVWFDRCQQLMDSEPRVKITNEWISTPQRNGAYVTAPLYLGGQFDLMFVDGRLRRDCLTVAPFFLAPGGLVVLHDANRPAYLPAFQFYDPAEIRDNTVILKPKSSS